jgi:hypothetical protein
MTEITFNSIEDYEAFLREYESLPKSERGEIHIEERVVLEKFDGDVNDASPVEVIEIVNDIVNGEIINSERREVKNGSN